MISVKNVSKSYKNVKALKNFSFDFDSGVYAILGPNGSGKSTLMNIMTGNLKKDAGDIILSSEESKKSHIEDIKIGYVSQTPSMYPNFTVFEMMDYMAVLKKAEKREEQIKELLGVFELSEHKNKRVRALSGGMKQRLAIAQSFLGDPNLIIMDEPTAGLDPLQRIIFKNFVSSRKGDITIIISTHIVSDVENIADEVIFLKKGEIAVSGSVEGVLSSMPEKCFSVPNDKAPQNIEYPHRSCGTDIRIIAPKAPFEYAEQVPFALEDCYLSVFGTGE
ncbi:MAG: ABC transporter ATP-binding protein [Eubacteriales bacterium]